MALSNSQAEWVKHPAAARLLTVEFPAHNGLTAEYLASNWWVPDHTASLGPVQFQGRLGQWRIERQVRSTWLGLPGNRAIIDYAPLDVADHDGGVSHWLFQATAWEGRPVIARWGSPSWLNPDDHIVRLRGIVERVERSTVNGQRFVRVVIKSRLAALDVSLTGQFYTAAEAPNASGQIKPVTHGYVANHEIKPLDTTNLVFGVSGNGGDPVRLRDRGVVLTKGVKILPGATDWIDNQDGTVTLGNVDGRITADTHGPTWPDVSASAVFQSICVDDVGLDPAWLDLSAIADMSGGNPRDIGFFADTQTTAFTVLDQVADSAGVAWYVNTHGKITAKRIEAPTITAAHEFSPMQIIGGVRSFVAVEPSPGLLLSVKKSWARQSADDISGAVPLADRSDLTESSKQIVQGSPSAKSICVPTLLTSIDQAEDEAERLYSYLGNGLTGYDFQTVSGAALVDLMDAASVVHSDQPELEPVTDESGDPLVDESWEPVHQGAYGWVVRLVESYPSGSLKVTII
jgi:hypothetical protein